MDGRHQPHDVSLVESPSCVCDRGTVVTVCYSGCQSVIFGVDVANVSKDRSRGQLVLSQTVLLGSAWCLKPIQFISLGISVGDFHGGQLHDECWTLDTALSLRTAWLVHRRSGSKGIQSGRFCAKSKWNKLRGRRCKALMSGEASSWLLQELHAPAPPYSCRKAAWFWTLWARHRLNLWSWCHCGFYVYLSSALPALDIWEGWCYWPRGRVEWKQYETYWNSHGWVSNPYIIWKNKTHPDSLINLRLSGADQDALALISDDSGRVLWAWRRCCCKECRKIIKPLYNIVRH